VPPHLGEGGDLVVRDERADDQRVSGTDLTQAADRRKGNEVRRLRQVELHHRQQALPPREQLCHIVPTEQRDRVADRRRPMVIEALHAAPPFAS
jgi:hypothetical protein